MFDFTEKHTLALKRHAMSFMQDHNLQDLNNVALHSLEWKDLNGLQADARRAASKAIDGLTEDAAPELMRSVELAVDALADLVRGIDVEKDTRYELGSRSPRQEGGDHRRPRGFEGSVDFAGNTIVGEDRSNAALAPEERMTSWARAKGHGDGYGDLTLGRYMRSMIVGAKTDVERRALAEGTDSAGGYTVPTMLSAQLIDLLRADSVIMRAGAQTVPVTSDNLTFARLASDPTPAWRAENAAVAESDPTFDSVPIVPRSLAVMTKISYELMQDSLNLERELPRIMGVALAKELDRVGLLGTGTAPEPRGIANMSGIGTTDVSGALALDDLLTARTGILTANAGPLSAIIMHPRDEGAISQMKDGDGNYQGLPPALSNVPILTTTAIPVNGGTGTNESTIFVGNFRSLMVGIRQDISIEVSKQVLMGNLQYLLVAHLRADFAASHAGAFHTLTAVQG